MSYLGQGAGYASSVEPLAFPRRIVYKSLQHAELEAAFPIVIQMSAHPTIERAMGLAVG